MPLHKLDSILEGETDGNQAVRELNVVRDTGEHLQDLIFNTQGCKDVTATTTTTTAAILLL